MVDGPMKLGLTKEQKAGAALLLVFGILTIGLGGLQLRNTIYGPFVIHPQTSENELVLDDNARLRQIDTDHDGISDYDELNRYETSPYLADTDSDGTADKAEIERGTNPICAEGKNCESDSALPVTTSTPAIPEPTDGEQDYQKILTGAQGGDNITVEEADALAKDPAALRELLRQSGRISAEDLAKLDDATLLSIAGDLIRSLSTQSTQTEAQL